MRLRLTGLPTEVQTAAERIASVLDVVETSTAYPCRGDSQQVRLYLEARP